MDFKFKVKYADVDIVVDDYEEGELDSVNRFSLGIDGEVYNTIDDLLIAINYAMDVFTTNPSDYYYIDGRIDTDATVNKAYEEPTDEEYEMWKRGELELYNAHLCCAIRMVPTGGEHDLTEEEAAAEGIYN